jgi:hypothetical protein
LTISASEIARGARIAWIDSCGVEAIRFLTLNVLPNTISA